MDSRYLQDMALYNWSTFEGSSSPKSLHRANKNLIFFGKKRIPLFPFITTILFTSPRPSLPIKVACIEPKKIVTKCLKKEVGPRGSLSTQYFTRFEFRVNAKSLSFSCNQKVQRIFGCCVAGQRIPQEH